MNRWQDPPRVLKLDIFYISFQVNKYQDIKMHETQHVSHLAMFLLLRQKGSGCMECMQMHQSEEMPSQGRKGRSARVHFLTIRGLGDCMLSIFVRLFLRWPPTSKKTVKKVKLQDAIFFKGGSGCASSLLYFQYQHKI